MIHTQSRSNSCHLATFI